LALPSARACDFFTTRLRVYRPWARETPLSEGTAHIFMRFDEVSQSDRLIGVESPMAEGADMVVNGKVGKIDLHIPAGVDTELLESGVFIRLTGLKQALMLGREYPLTLIFEHGGALSADMDIDFTRNERLS
jgi:copper(I)-binding protein